MRPFIEKFIAELMQDANETYMVEVGQNLAGTFWARIRASAKASRAYPLFDRQGECELLAHGKTLSDALAALDVICSR